MYKPFLCSAYAFSLGLFGAYANSVATSPKAMLLQIKFASSQSVIKKLGKKKNTYIMNTSISEQELAWSKAVGNNTIYGSAFVRASYRGIQISQKCSGLVVELIPKSAYADERMNFYFDNLKRGYLDHSGNVKKKRGQWQTKGKRSPAAKKGTLLGEDNPMYKDSVRESYCDQRGDFLFENIPDGEYYLTNKIVWGAEEGENGWRPGKSTIYGGSMMQHVKVSGGIRQRAILSGG